MSLDESLFGEKSGRLERFEWVTYYWQNGTFRIFAVLLWLLHDIY